MRVMSVQAFFLEAREDESDAIEGFSAAQQVWPDFCQ